MKKFQIVRLILLGMCASCSASALREVVNKIIARVNGTNILQSDLTLVRVDGERYPLSELIIKELYVQEAAKRKLLPTALEVEKQVASYKSSRNLQKISDEDFEKHLNGIGFSIRRYKSEIARHIGISSLLQMEVRSRVFVTKQEVEEYYKAHPEKTEAQYLLKTAIVPFDLSNPQETKPTRAPHEDEWVLADDWIVQSDIAESMHFVGSLKKGQLSKPFKTPYGYQYVTLIDKKPTRLKTLDERYVEIEKLLNKTKLENFEKEFQEELRSRAFIIYL